MADVPLGGAGRKIIPCLLPVVIERRRRDGRPPPCVLCRGAAWWNGWRVVWPVVATSTAGAVERRELSLSRAKCSSCLVGFTCYPSGFYPGRQYQLDVVAEVVAAVTLGGEPVEQAAATCSASATSARRWTAWVAALASAGELHAAAARLDASTATVAATAVTSPRPRASAVLAALEVLGAALVRVGVTVVERTGLGRVLGWQHRRHGDVYGLVVGPTRFSPAMAPEGRHDTR